MAEGWSRQRRLISFLCIRDKVAFMNILMISIITVCLSCLPTLPNCLVLYMLTFASYKLVNSDVIKAMAEGLITSQSHWVTGCPRWSWLTQFVVESLQEWTPGRGTILSYKLVNTAVIKAMTTGSLVTNCQHDP